MDRQFFHPHHYPVPVALAIPLPENLTSGLVIDILTLRHAIFTDSESTTLAPTMRQTHFIFSLLTRGDKIAALVTSVLVFAIALLTGYVWEAATALPLSVPVRLGALTAVLLFVPAVFLFVTARPLANWIDAVVEQHWPALMLHYRAGRVFLFRLWGLGMGIVRHGETLAQEVGRGLWYQFRVRSWEVRLFVP